jgi:NAD(P)H-dependent nitrite reductase small subunit
VSDEFVRVARVADVPPGSAIPVRVGERAVALFHVDGTFYALDNACPHKGGPLCEGAVAGKHVICPWHDWTFSLEDGRMTFGDYALLDVYDVRVEGEDIVIGRTPRPRRPPR